MYKLQDGGMESQSVQADDSDSSSFVILALRVARKRD